MITLEEIAIPFEERSIINSSHRLWHVTTSHSGRTGTMRIDPSRYPITEESSIFATQVLAIKLKELNYGAHNPVSSSFYFFSSTLFLLLSLREKFYFEKKLADLSKVDLMQLYTQALLFKHNTTRRAGQKVELVRLSKPKTVTKIESFITLNRWLHKAYHAGLISDGPDFHITRKSLKKYATQYLAHEGVDQTSWGEAGSYSSIPFVVANLLLADAIEVIESEKAKHVLAYFDSIRNANLPSSPMTLWCVHNNRIKKFRTTSNEEYLLNRNGREQHRTTECIEKILIPLHKEMERISGKNYKFPWPKYTNFISDYNLITTASYVIFLSLLGKRGPSEVLTLRGCDITPGQKNESTIRSQNHKSYQGVRIEHGVSSFIENAFSILANCSYVNKSGTDLPLFSTLPNINNIHAPQNAISIGHSFDLLKSYYDGFIARSSSRVDFNIREVHPSIGTHQFRHTFAEFALRRFDGNVEEMLRQVFQHGSKHWWIKRYTADKLDEETIQRLNREYIQELIPRALRDLDELEKDFVGGMAIYLKTVIAPKVRHLTPKEFESFVVSLSYQFSLTPHEYGWCMLLSEYSNQACCSTDGAHPNPQGTDSGKCNGCMHFMSSKSSHFSVQKLITINHIDFIECGFWQSNSLREASIKAVKDAQRLFPELRELGEF